MRSEAEPRRLAPISLLALCSASLGTLGAGCLETPAATSSPLTVLVAPLTLPNISFACYDLRVQNDLEQTVWSLGTVDPSPTDTTTVCSNQYGNSAGGDISYVGTCDASENDAGDGKTALNHVTLWVDGLYDASGDDIGEYQNPCKWPNGCTLSFECKENADVQVGFDLTILREANQGFFDIGVDFEDIFCSAKADTCYAGTPGRPIELVAHSGRTGATDGDGDGRYLTAVSALACTASPGTNQATTLRMSQPVITCANGNTCTLAPAGTPGNNIAPCSGGKAVAYAIYRGLEDLDCGPGSGSCQKVYWNIAVNLEDIAAAGFRDCQLDYDATATSATGPSFEGIAPGQLVGPSITYPAIHFASPLLVGTTAACGWHSVDQDEVVATQYLQGCDLDDGPSACELPALCNTLANVEGVAVATPCGPATPTNRSPLFTGAFSSQLAIRDQSFNYDFGAAQFSDPDGDALTLSATLDGGGALPAWLTFDGLNHRFYGTPAASDVDTIVIAVTATDTLGASVSTTFGLDVLPGNQPPVVSPGQVDVGAIAAGTTRNFDLSSYVSDPDGTFGNGMFWIEYIDDQPQYLSLDDLMLTFTPNEEEPGATFSFTVHFSDGEYSTSLVVNGSITGMNHAPYMPNPYPDIIVNVGAEFTRDLNAYFSDPDGDTLTYVVGSPYGLAVPGIRIVGNTVYVTPNASAGTALLDLDSNVIGQYWYMNIVATDPGGLTVVDQSGGPATTLITIYWYY